MKILDKIAYKLGYTIGRIHGFIDGCKHYKLSLKDIWKYGIKK